MDFSVESFAGLGQAERQRLCRQVRRRQVENYLEFIAREQQQQPQPPRPLPRGPNRRNTAVHFRGDVCLQSAVEEADEKEVLRFLHSGADFNFATGNGTSLLHKCCAEGNLAVAELLVLKGADVNTRDDDWWTPLHVACYQDHADIAQLLLTNGADVSLMDVDGNFPLDHVPQNTDTWDTVISFMEAKGLTEGKVKKLRQARSQQVEAEIRGMIRTAGDLNAAVGAEGVTLLHIVSANGYTKCAKLLLKNGAMINATTAAGWTPLHCAAKFSQIKMAELLIKSGADTKAVDRDGNRALDLASDEEIQKLILEARRAERQSMLVAGQDCGDGGDQTDDEEGVMTKIVRPAHLPLSKADRLMEGQMMMQAQSSTVPQSPTGEASLPGTDVRDESEGNEIYEEIFSSTVYSKAKTEQEKLPAPSAQDDLSSLSTLTDRLILDSILQRYKQKQIYTYMGDVLIAVNPFTDLPIYGKWASRQYHQAENLNTLTPHVYAVGERAQRTMMSSRSSQCCVISGESGAGKTETCKLLVQHLMCSAESSEHQLNSKLHQINPLLEAFGNAQTTMNSNSSRFAKYLELIFAPDGRVLGGHLHQYLLEKSRVVHQGPLEGNFHIFYWLLAGATPEEKTQCCLDETSFNYLQCNERCSPSTSRASGQNKLLEVKECMKFVGFSQDDVTNMLTTVAAVLHLGNVSFKEQGDHELLTVTQPNVLGKVSSLLRVPYEDLVSALTEDILTARGEELRKPLRLGQALDNRNALAKALYSRLFAWIVNGLNQMVAPLEDAPSERLSIGILDIFGFEHLQLNGFEQMCINLANEQLQIFYQQQMFEREHQDCLTEGVPPVDITFPSSQQVIDVFMEKNTGVYDLLDEESRFPKASDETLATKLHYYLGKKHDQVYKTPRYGGTTFTIVHYAGAVQYELDGILEKNRDTLRNALSFVMRSSDSLLVKELFQSAITKTGSISPSARQRVSRKIKPSRSPFEFFKKLRQSKHDNRGKRDQSEGDRTSRKLPTTLTYHFKNSLREMLAKLESSAPHFIRCIKPANSGQPLAADAEYITAQLRYSGVLQTTILRKHGYAVRCTFQEFVGRFPSLAVFTKLTTSSGDHRSQTVNMLTTAGVSDAQVSNRVGLS